MAWEATGLEEVLLVAGAFAGEPLAAVVERLLRDHASWRAGLPDLVLVNEKVKGESRRRVVKRWRGERTMVLCRQGPPLHGIVYVVMWTGVGVTQQVFFGPRGAPVALLDQHALTFFLQTSQGRLVEVKSPGDRLSDQQVAWLHVLHAAGADVAVLRVQSADGAD